MFFHIVSIVMFLYIRIIPYWLFLSYLIYLWFCFQSVIFSEKLLRNSKNPFQRHLFLFLRSKPDFLKFFPVFQENLGFYLKILIFSQTKNSLERCQFQFIQFFFGGGISLYLLIERIFFILYIIYIYNNIIYILFRKIIGTKKTE